MAAPTLQAEGTLSVVTTGALAPAIPTHQTDDILVVAWGFWGPNSTSLPDAAVPSGWAAVVAQVSFGVGSIDGKIGYFWKRAAAAGQTISIARPSGWDTGADTAWGGRAYVIRGAITTGDPWDEADPTVLYAVSNQQVDILTVLGAERLAIHFLVKPDDFATAPTVSGWTAGTQVEATTGTDHSQGSFRMDNVGADTPASFSTVEVAVPADNRYMFLGISFKPVVLANPTISSASMADADRDWDAPLQDIAITFSELVDITPAPAVGDTIAGLTAQVNGGANAALTYRSGSGTASWKVRRAELIQQNDTVVLDYAQASGIILAVDDNAELSETVDAAVTNNLTKRARFTLRDSLDALVASETVKYGLFQYDSGLPANADWMTRDTKGTVTTTAAGLVDVQYTGAVAVGGTIYVVIIRPDTTPTQSMVWTDVVQ